MDKVDITIVGAGVIGLALAARLARPDRLVVVCEQHDRFGQETSSRNSEVIHAGIYYPPHSLKARLCVAGNPKLYAFCEQHGIAHARLGKIIVATTPEELPQLQHWLENGEQNQVPGLELLTPDQVKTLEPELSCLGGLYSPTTGILDTHGLMETFFQQAQRQDALIVFGSEVTGLTRKPEGFQVVLKNGGEQFLSRIVINAAGLGAERVASLAGLAAGTADYGLHLSKGDYFRTSQTFQIKHLVYPVPHLHVNNLGIHLTKDLAGGTRFGPDATYVDGIDYQIDENKKHRFGQAIQHYLPQLDPGRLYPDTAGIRPKLQGPEEGFRDFVIQHEGDRGLEGMVNLIGIESPGLTCALSIAEEVERQLAGVL